MLSTSAFNALLKTLEEPPEHVFFVMATTEAHKIPNTILSRCQRFDFRRIPTSQIAEHLKKICTADKVKFQPDALWAIARQGDGSMRDSQSLLEQVINFSQGETHARQNDGHSRPHRSPICSSTLGRRLLARDGRAIVEQIRKLFHLSLDPKVFIQDLLEEIRHTLLLKIAPQQSELVDLPDSEKEQLKKLSANFSAEDLHLLFDMALKGAQDLSRASDPKLVLEMVLLRMAEAPRVRNLNALLASGAGLSVPRSVSVPVTGSVSASASASASVGRSAPVGNEAKWKDLVEKIKTVNGMIGAQLENVYVTEIQGDLIKVVVPNKLKFLFDKLNNPDFKKRVSNYIQTYWGSAYRLDVQVATETAATRLRRRRRWGKRRKPTNKRRCAKRLKTIR